MIQQNLLKDYDNQINWSVESLFAHDRFVWELLELCKVYHVEVPIYSVYGSVPCLFQGNKIPPRDASLDNAKDILKKYDECGISCRLTFSNPSVSDLSDKLSNELLDTLNQLPNTRHGVIIADDNLATYIRETYKNLDVISSISKPILEKGLCEDDVDYYNRLFDLYDYIYVNPSKVNDNVFLNELKYPERVIFTVNNKCIPDCKLRREHLDLINKINVKDINQEPCAEDLEKLTELISKCKETHKKFPLLGNQVSQTDINYLTKLGYTNLSIEGRDFESTCFIRDIGEYIFNYFLYDSIATSIMEGNI